MRVITGRFKGRRLTCPPGGDVRPTTDRVKEAVFSILGARVAGAVVFDLCCGSGSLGIEAVSRGAAEVLFVDNSRQALAATRANLDHCRAEAAGWSLVQDDALAFSARIADHVRGRPWVLLCDPPYASGLAAELLARGPAWRSIPGFEMAVVEMGALPGSDDSDASIWELRRYGRTVLAVARGTNPGDEHE